MARSLVIGVGSSLRRDDAAGRRVAEEVEARSLPDVEVIVATQLLPEMIEAIAAADRVVVVDASVSVTGLMLGTVEPQAGSGRSHHATPAGLLGLAERLGFTVPPVFLLEIPAHDLSFGEGLSPQTAALVDDAVAEVLTLLVGGG